MEITTYFWVRNKAKMQMYSKRSETCRLKLFHRTRECLSVSTEALNNLNTDEIKISEQILVSIMQT